MERKKCWSPSFKMLNFHVYSHEVYMVLKRHLSQAYSNWCTSWTEASTTTRHNSKLSFESRSGHCSISAVKPSFLIHSLFFVASVGQRFKLSCSPTLPIKLTKVRSASEWSVWARQKRTGLFGRWISHMAFGEATKMDAALAGWV